MAVSDWSITPSANATQPGINWAEGQPPSTVNNSARQMMSDIKVYSLASGRGIDLIANSGCVADGVTLGNGAKINTALASGAGYIWVPDGVYIIDQDLIVPDNITIQFSGGAVFKADVNGRTFFKSTTHAYFSQIWNANLNGNGKTGVTGFDMTNFRIKAGLFNCVVNSMDIGLILRGGTFGVDIVNFASLIVPRPIQVLANSSNMVIDSPSLDNEAVSGGNGTGVGIDIRAGAGTNLGVRIIGGYVQGFDIGLLDAGIGTKATDTYFETCGTADISATAARACAYSGIQHFGPVGALAYKLRTCDAVTIFNPTMGSGARPFLYDVDATNTNCTEYRAVSNASYNFPTGSLAYLGSVPTQTIGTFAPVVVGSAGAGAATYSVQSGKWSRTGNVVHFDMTVTWTGHTGTGALVITGLPGGLSPAVYTPQRTFLAAPNGLAFTGPLIWAVLNGTTTNMTVQQSTAVGAVSLVPIAAAGGLTLTGSYEM